jgi:DNA-binding CsgD family transcriptional regulator/PAS domain-containing protein
LEAHGGIVNLAFEYRALLEAVSEHDLPFALWEGQRVTIRLVNEAFARRVGVPASQLLGRPWPDVWQPRSAMMASAAAVASGAVEAVWARRRITRDAGSDPVWVWVRRVTLGGMVGGVTVVVPEATVHRFGASRRTSQLYPLTLATGFADREWRIEHASKELASLTGISQPDLIGQRVVRIVDFPEGRPMTRPAGALWNAHTERVLVRRLGHQPVSASFTSAPRADLPRGHTLFAIVAELHERAGGRAQELEAHLRRIAAEVEAAGVLAKIEALSDLDASLTLEGLTTRQWEILSRLRRGERVASIASQLYLSQSTVRNHLSIIFRKFGVHSQAELMEQLRQRVNRVPALDV